MLEASSPVGEKRNLQQAVESEDQQHQRRKGNTVQAFSATTKATDRQKHETGLCPCCSENKSLSRTFNSVAMGFAVMAEPSMMLQLQQRGFELADSPRPFRVCGACYRTWQRTLATANKTQPNEVGKLGQISSRKQKPIVLETPFSFCKEHLTLVS